MIQKINFYDYMYHPIRSSIDIKNYLYITIIFALLLTLVQIFMNAGLRSDEKELTTVQINLQKSIENLQALQKEYGELTGQSNSAMKDICKIKLSEYLKAFARAHVAGLWLTEINISNSGTEFKLIGRATQTTQVNLYIEDLKNQPIFAKFNFELSNLTGLRTGNQITEAGLFNVSIVGKVKT